MRILFSLIILFLFSNSSFSQKRYKNLMQDNSVNFYDVCIEAEKYFETHDKGKGSGWKGYQRWKNENESKYAPSGIRNNIDPLFVAKEYQQIKKEASFSSSKTLYTNGWNDLGPYRIDSITGAYSTGLGRIVCSYVHRTNTQIMYIGSRSGGFWKSTNGGGTWKGTTDDLVASGVGFITAKPTDANHILIDVQNGGNTYSHAIYRSIDGGETWEETNFNPTNLGQGGLGSSFRINMIKFHPRVANLVFVTTNNGLYRSTDNLDTWTQIAGVFSNITQLEFHPTDDNILYIYRKSGSDKNKVLRSLDQGLTFIPSETITDNASATAYFSVSDACADCMYFASTNGVWMSKDTAKTFTFLSNPPQTCKGFAVNDIDTSKMVYGYVDVETSEDGGRTFNQKTWWSLGAAQHGGGDYQYKLENSGRYIHADLHPAIAINGVYYVGTDGFFCKSEDNGGTWEILSQGTGIRENYCLGASQSNHFRSISGSQDNGTSIKHQNTWIEFYGADGMEGIIHPLNDDWMIGSLQYGGRRRTKDGGLTQNNASPPGQSGEDNGGWIAPIAYNPNNSMEVVNFSKNIFKSTDFGTSWDSVGTPSFSGTISEAAIAENNPDILIVSRESAIKKSIDGGVSFFDIKNNLPGYTITDIAFNPKDDENFFVTYNRYQNDGKKIYMTNDGGQSWENITYNLVNMPIRSIVADHTNEVNIYVGAEIGVYTKTINDTIWTLYNQGLPNSTIKELEVINGSNTLRAATWGRGLWEYSLVGRNDYPAILQTRINDLPTDDKPKETTNQYVTSIIAYNGKISKTYVKWSVDTPAFDNTINMTNTIDSTWKSDTPLPDYPSGTKMYFKVYTIGGIGDTTETYKFMYEIKPFQYCQGSGTTNTGNLYISNFTLKNINNNSTYDSYQYFGNQVLNLEQDSTYTISLECNNTNSLNKASVWIDYNRDAVFDTDESIVMSTFSNQIATGTFTVPTYANNLDTLRLRARLYYANATNTPCGSSFGEVEDYPLLISGNNFVTIVEINKNEVSVFPNPTNGELTLRMENKINSGIVRIHNNLGKLMLEKSVLNKNEIKLNIGAYANGLYFISVQTENSTSVIKVLKNE